jgi:hypothetical protein
MPSTTDAATPATHPDGTRLSISRQLEEVLFLVFKHYRDRYLHFAYDNDQPSASEATKAAEKETHDVSADIRRAVGTQMFRHYWDEVSTTSLLGRDS